MGRVSTEKERASPLRGVEEEGVLGARRSRAEPEKERAGWSAGGEKEGESGGESPRARAAVVCRPRVLRAAGGEFGAKRCPGALVRGPVPKCACCGCRRGWQYLFVRPGTLSLSVPRD